MPKLQRLLRDPRRVIGFLARRRLLDFLPDRPFLRLHYWSVLHGSLDLAHPVTFNQKLQWLKLYDRNPLYTTLVDKAAVKEYVASKIGERYVIPTLGLWDSFEDIDFDRLPDQFVLKCTHDSGGLILCRDKAALDRSEAAARIRKTLRTNYYKHNREWPYKDVPRKVIAEQLLVDARGELPRDYKFFCFHGEPKAMFIVSNRAVDARNDFFDMDFHHLPMVHGHPNADVMPEKPATFEEMKRIAAQLSQGIPQVRVDLYELDGRVYFGELTFFDWGGLGPFTPACWDETFGSWLTLPRP
ncbi:MAG: glycosyl transferase [Clostridiales bacterium]|nr:glycosyl transferase [Clostridiales bacterium]